jgi:hypothetical protein
MLRFPNPGSTIANFVAVFTAAFRALDGKVATLDDITSTVVAANLATSSGYMGDEAIARSQRPDRSRDPLYNQSKMYAELFRAMGWLHPTEETSLNFTFTLLGRQIVEAGPNYLPLFGECILGICYPSRVLQIIGNHNLRPFASIVATMMNTGGHLSRDEMILGPLSALSDRSAADARDIAARVKSCRASSAVVQRELNSLGKDRSVQINTLKNYTRWPIAVLRDCRWAEKATAKFVNGGSYQTFKLTADGEAIGRRIQDSLDIRLDEIEKLSSEERAVLSRHAYYAMLRRAGFDLEPVAASLNIERPTLERVLLRFKAAHDRELLYSPFQTVAPKEIARIFPSVASSRAEAPTVLAKTSAPQGRGDKDHLFVAPILIPISSSAPPKDNETAALEKELLACVSRHKTPKQAAEAFALDHSGDTKSAFYPLVSNLFQLMKFKSDVSRGGVNYQRWDAAVWVGDSAVPVEIKSPTEEQFLSTKAIRQAIENKIILLSRGGLKTSKELTSLIVGYKIPNERAEMASLIDDIYSAFGLHVGVIDLATLARLAIISVSTGKTLSGDQLGKLRGFLHD